MMAEYLIAVAIEVDAPRGNPSEWDWSELLGVEASTVMAVMEVDASNVIPPADLVRRFGYMVEAHADHLHRERRDA